MLKGVDINKTLVFHVASVCKLSGRFLIIAHILITPIYKPLGYFSSMRMEHREDGRLSHRNVYQYFICITCMRKRSCKELGTSTKNSLLLVVPPRI